MRRLDVGSDNVLRLEYTPDGTGLVVQGRDDDDTEVTVVWWDWQTEEEGPSWRTKVPAAFNGPHTLIAACRAGRWAPGLFDGRTRRTVGRLVWDDGGGAPVELAITPNSRWLVVRSELEGNEGGLFWHEVPARFWQSAVPRPRSTSGIAFSPSGEWYATQGEDNSFPVVPTDSHGGEALAYYGEAYWHCEEPGDCGLARVFLSEDVLVSIPGAYVDERLMGHTSLFLWDVPAREGREIPTGHDGPLTSAAVTADGLLLVTGSEDGTVRLWDTRGWSMLAAHDWTIGPVTALAFAPDGRTCAAGGGDTVVIWDLD